MLRVSWKLASKFLKAVEARQWVTGSDSLKEALRSHCMRLGR